MAVDLDEPVLGNYPKRIDGDGDPGECEGEGGADEGGVGGLGLGSFLGRLVWDYNFYWVDVGKIGCSLFYEIKSK